MPTREMQLGQLGAQVLALRDQLDDVKKNMENTRRQLDQLVTEFRTFSTHLTQEMEQRFITRLELAPVKSVLSMIVLTTVSGICLALVQLLFNSF